MLPALLFPPRGSAADADAPAVRARGRNAGEPTALYTGSLGVSQPRSIPPAHHQMSATPLTSLPPASSLQASPSGFWATWAWAKRKHMLDSSL